MVSPNTGSSDIGAQFQQSGGDKEKKPEKKEPQQQVTPLPQIPDGVSDDEFKSLLSTYPRYGLKCKVSKERKTFFLDKMSKTQKAR